MEMPGANFLPRLFNFKLVFNFTTKMVLDFDWHSEKSTELRQFNAMRRGLIAFTNHKLPFDSTFAFV